MRILKIEDLCGEKCGGLVVVSLSGGCVVVYFVLEFWLCFSVSWISCLCVGSFNGGKIRHYHNLFN